MLMTECLETSNGDPEALECPRTVQDLSKGLRDLRSKVRTARLLVPINNWDFSDRVWAGLRPQLRSRLCMLETVLAVPCLPGSRPPVELTAFDQVAGEIYQIEAEVEQVLRRRTRLSEFSVLLERRLTPCLDRLEQLQRALNEPDVL